MVGQSRLVLSQERACSVVTVRLHHNYSQLYGDHPDVGVERNLQYHFEKKSYQYHVVFENLENFNLTTHSASSSSSRKMMLTVFAVGF